MPASVGRCACCSIRPFARVTDPLHRICIGTHVQCFRYISDKGDGVTLDEIASFIRDKKISTVQLRMEEVNQIVDTLVYDGRVDAIDSNEMGMGGIDDDCVSQMTYKAATLAIPTDSIFTSVGYSLYGSGFNEWLEDGEVADYSYAVD